MLTTQELIDKVKLCDYVEDNIHYLNNYDYDIRLEEPTANYWQAIMLRGYCLRLLESKMLGA